MNKVVACTPAQFWLFAVGVVFLERGERIIK